MRRIGSVWTMFLAAGLAVVGATSGHAQSGPVVVELFTSQGCAACPPADALLAELNDRDDVLPLALHVDYWDYIGWKDSFASPGYTRRQRGYAHAAGSTMIYTPQMIVAGRFEVAGYKPGKLMTAIEQAMHETPQVAIRAEAADGKLAISLEPLTALDRSATVILVHYKPKADVKIERGENAGLHLSYVNIVTEWRILGQWPGDAPLRIDVPYDKGLPGAVLVQEDGYGEMLAAARLR